MLMFILLYLLFNNLFINGIRKSPKNSRFLDAKFLYNLYPASKIFFMEAGYILLIILNSNYYVFALTKIQINMKKNI